MDIVKYFYEEPTLLEALTPDTDADARRQQAMREKAGRRARMPLEDVLAAPAYHRGYLAGTNLDTGAVGLTALARPEAVFAPVMDWLAGRRWQRGHVKGVVEEIAPEAARAALAAPAETSVLVCADAPLATGLVADAAGTARRQTVAALRRLLDAAHVAFFPEPAHNGTDWSFFADHPMREALTAAFRRHPATGARRFALPYQRARSEQKFYFEQWRLDDLPDYVEEV